MEKNGSPTNIKFQYANSHFITNNTPKIVSKNQTSINYHPLAYSPRLIQSGFLIGEPVAFSDRPILPNEFKQFSPKKSAIISNSVVKNVEGSQK
jgi:hypothetical protein